MLCYVIIIEFSSTHLLMRIIREIFICDLYGTMSFISLYIPTGIIYLEILVTLSRIVSAFKSSRVSKTLIV